MGSFDFGFAFAQDDNAEPAHPPIIRMTKRTEIVKIN
jgi:hypothetical protein